MIDKEKINYFAGYLFSTKLTCKQYEQAITEWLEQNHPEPVVVGLSDEQVIELATCLFNAENQTMTWTEKTKVVISDWLSKQTFSQTRAFDDSELSEKYMNLYDDYQSLLNP